MVRKLGYAAVGISTIALSFSGTTLALNAWDRYRLADLNITSSITSAAVIANRQAGPEARTREGAIEVREATFGGSCEGSTASPSRKPAHIIPGNATAFVAKTCNTKGTCTFVVDVSAIGDPANGCSKDFTVSWRCGPAAPVNQINVPATAEGKQVMLACPATL
jgi:hypothetical protein